MVDEHRPTGGGPPIDANNAEANTYLYRLGTLIDSLQARAKEAEEECAALQKQVEELQGEVNDIEERNDELEEERDSANAEAEEAKEVVQDDIRLLTRWLMELGADPTDIFPQLSTEAGETMRGHALKCFDLWPSAATPTPLGEANKAAVLASVRTMCENGTAPPEAVAAYQEAGVPPAPTDPALEGFA